MERVWCWSAEERDRGSKGRRRRLRGRTGEGLCPVGFSPSAGKMENLGTDSLVFSGSVEADL